MLVNGLEAATKAEHDVCIVGSGPVGLALAGRLVKTGMRVLVLESGAVNADPKIQALAEADIDPNFHDPMSIVTSRQLGGTSNLWGARALPFDPIDFEDRDWVSARWPIRYEDIVPYLPDAVAATASGAPVYEEPLGDDLVDRTFAAAAHTFRANALERWANEQRAQAIHSDTIKNSTRLTVCTGVTAVDLHFTENGRVKGLGVSGSIDGRAAILPITEVVLAAGGIETARLLLSTQRQAEARFGGINGPLGRYYQGHVVGEIAEIHFCRPELARAFDFRVDQFGSYVRRRIVATAETQRAERLLNCAFWPVVPRIGQADHRSAILSMIYIVMKTGPVARMIVAEKIRQMNISSNDSHIIRHFLNVIQGMPEAMLFGFDFLSKRFDKKTRLPGLFVRNSSGRYGLSYHSEQIPNPQSRVTLTDKLDRIGQAKLKIDLKFLPEDINSIMVHHKLLADWLSDANIANLKYHLPEEDRFASILEQARHGTHQIGITRMGSSPSEGVVDANCTSFDAPNLHLATTGVLPTSGQANPTLTAIALALRLGDRLALRAGKV